MGRWAALAAMAVLLGVPAQAYYHYVYFQRTALSSPIRAQFNLAALPNNTVAFYVSDSGPSIYYPNDSFGSVLGEIKQALAVWNSVGSSNLRLAFGGLESQSQAPQNTPGADVVFDDLPGLLGMGTPNLPVAPTLTPGPNGSSFVAISRSTVILTNNTANTEGLPFQSYTEGYFTTVVHEIGHALGLQHTWTGAAMSQDVIRNTSRARAIDADDIAALSVLYGAPGWSANFGSISGNVNFTNGGGGVNLASVVAISPTGPAISTLTNPDGSYLIQGVPPGMYQLYVHPLPPDAILANGTGILLPSDLTGKTFAASSVFSTQFFPGTQSWQQAGPIAVTAAGTTTASFVVQARSSVSMYDMETYSYLGPNQTPQTPAYVNVSSGQFVIATWPNNPPAATPVSVGVLGMGNAYGIVPDGATAWALYFNVPQPWQAVGPRHLVFNSSSDMYVLPDGVNFTLMDPPTISSATPNSNGTVNVSGNNFTNSSSVFFDGLPAPGAFNNGVITVTPPTGASGQLSTLTVFNGDGQNSMFLQSANPQTFQYPAAAQPQITSVTPATLPAGISSMVTVNASNTNFVAGQVSVGFGTTDILVNNIWVVSPTQVLVNVTVPPGAAMGASEISVISGFQVMSQPFGFQIQQANPALPSIAWPAINAATGGALYPGSYASIFPANGTQFPSGIQLTLNGSPVAIQYNSPGQINFAVPPGFPLGPAMLSIINGGNVVSIVVEIDSPSALQPILNQAR